MFKDEYQRLNPSQKQAVDTIEGPVMVIAGPGTGKTQILTLRIANILRLTQSNPDNILALTFTDAGVSAMRKRLTSFIGKDAYNVHIHTFHGFASMVINAHPDEFPTLHNTTPLSDLEKTQLFRNIVESIQLDHLTNINAPYIYLQAIDQAISKLKQESISPSAFRKSVATSASEFKSIHDLYWEKGPHKGKMKGKYKKLEKDIKKQLELALVYDEYSRILDTTHRYDFNDMLNIVNQAFSRHVGLLQSYQEQYHYLLIDEHQDTNHSQHLMAQLIMSYHNHPNIFTVGDHNQAIYRFQGASISNFLKFQTQYPDTAVIALDTNYRSTQDILDLSMHLATDTSSIPTHNLLAARRQVGDISHVVSKNMHEQYQYLAKVIKNSSNDAQTCAILTRTNKELEDIVPYLEKESVSYHIRGKQNVLQNSVVKKLLDLLTALNDPTNNTKLARTMFHDIHTLHPIDVATLIRQAKAKKTPLISYLSEIEVEKYIDAKAINAFYHRLTTWISLVHNQPFDQAISTIIHGSGIIPVLVSDEGRWLHIKALSFLFDFIQSKIKLTKEYALADFLQDIDTIKEHNIRFQTPSLSSSDGVTLSTVHSSKGLEYDQVYIPNLHKGKWGDKRLGGPKISIPEERLEINITDIEESEYLDEQRLLYVGLTRAKSKLMMLSSESTNDGKELLPSRFIVDLQDLKSIENTASSDSDDIITIITQGRIRDPKKLTQSGLIDYITTVFSEQPLSVSALNNYLDCPWKYFFRNLVRLPEAKSPSLVFGSIIHSVIHQAVMKKITSASQLLSIFENEMSQASLPDDAASTSNTLDQLKKEGSEILPVYFESVMKSWPDTIITEKSIHALGFSDHVSLTGKIDAMIPTDKNNEYVDVVDFKTGTPKSRNYILGNTANSNGDYHRQLVFYALLLSLQSEKRHKLRKAAIQFVKPQSEKIVTHWFEISQDEIQDLTSTINNTVQNILAGVFFNKACDDPSCQYCDLRSHM